MGKTRRHGRRPDPGDDWNDEELDVDEAIKLAKEIQTMLGDDVTSSMWERGEDFFISVEEGVAGIRETMESSRSVSKKQYTALENWKSGIEKWLERSN